MMVYLKPLENTKLESFNIRDFEMWRQFMNSKSISTGYINGELRGLTWNDIDFNRSTLTVNKNIVKVPDPKTGNPYTVTSPKTSSSYRTIPTPNFLLKDFSDLYNDDANYYGFRESWYVFGNIDPLSATTLLDRKTKNAFMARVKDIRIHDFRHSCASLLIDSGANITIVAKYLGHTKIDETLNTYSHMYQNRLDTIVNIIELQNSRLNNKVIEAKPTILLEHKDIYNASSIQHIVFLKEDANFESS